MRYTADGCICSAGVYGVGVARPPRGVLFIWYLLQLFIAPLQQYLLFSRSCPESRSTQPKQNFRKVWKPSSRRSMPARWLRLTVLSIMPTILTTLYSQDDASRITGVVVCPFEIVGEQALHEVLHKPLSFYQTYSHHWLQQPIAQSETDRFKPLTVPYECVPEGGDRGPACEGCQDLNATYYECFHIRVPQKISECADNWCIEVKLIAKDCFVRSVGTEPNRCRVLKISTEQGAPPAITHTIKYSGRHGTSGWCRTESLRGPHAFVFYGCPDCQADRVRMWCNPDTQSKDRCKRGRAVPPTDLPQDQDNPITTDYGFVCANDDCTPRTNNPEQPREQQPGQSVDQPTVGRSR